MSKYKATLSLLGISVFLQCLISLWPDLLGSVSVDPHSILFPLRLITGMMSHGGWGHLIGNYITGLPFMLWLEGNLGRTKFLELWFLTGIAGSMLSIITGYDGQSVGSSAAVCGMIAAACCLFGSSKIEHVVACLFAMCILVPQILMSPYQFLTGIGYWAHIGGILSGILLTHRLYRLPQKASPLCKPPKRH